MFDNEFIYLLLMSCLFMHIKQAPHILHDLNYILDCWIPCSECTYFIQHLSKNEHFDTEALGCKFANVSHRHPTLSISINPQLTVMDILRRPKPVILIAMLLMVLSIERQLVWTSGWDLEIGEVASILQESLLDPLHSIDNSSNQQVSSSLGNPHQSPLTLQAEAQLSCHAMSSKCLRRILFRH